MNKRETSKREIDALVWRAMSGRLVAVGAIALAKELGLPWRSVTWSLSRLVKRGRLVAEVVVVEASYRWSGFETTRYRKHVEHCYPAWLLPQRKSPQLHEGEEGSVLQERCS